MAYLKAKILIHLACETQIALPVVKKVIILAEYLNFKDIFSKKPVAELLKRFDINKYSINLKLSK